MGAQLKRGGTCEVLTVKEVDPTNVPIPGGWGIPPGPSKAEDVQIRLVPKVAESAHAEDVKVAIAAGGKGLVAATTDEAAYNCWQLN